MGKESKKEQNNKENPILTSVLLEQLDKWISDCQLQADVFFENGMTISEASSLAMKIAYINVRTLIENTINNKIDRDSLMNKLEEIQNKNYAQFKGSNEADLMIREDVADLFEKLLQ